MTRISTPAIALVVLEIQCAPIVNAAPVIEAESDIFVNPMPVKITASSAELEVRFTLDGREPTNSSRIYRYPIPLNDTTTVQARAFREGKPVSGVVAKKFERVEPRPGQPGPHVLPKGADLLDPRYAKDAPWLRQEVECSRYLGDWDKLPEFESLANRPTDNGWVDQIALLPTGAVNRTAERVALLFSGVVRIETADVYVYELTSDDGSRLWIDDQLVVDNDGLHSALKKTGRVALGPGIHDIRVAWFNKSGGAELSVKSAPLGAVLTPVLAYTQCSVTGIR